MTGESPMTTTSCCEEFARSAGLSRRGLLRGAAVVGGAAAVTAVHGTAFTSTAYAAAPVDRVLVLLSMRGASSPLPLALSARFSSSNRDRSSARRTVVASSATLKGLDT